MRTARNGSTRSAPAFAKGCVFSWGVGQQGSWGQGDAWVRVSMGVLQLGVCVPCLSMFSCTSVGASTQKKVQGMKMPSLFLSLSLSLSPPTPLLKCKARRCHVGSRCARALFLFAFYKSNELSA